MLQLIAAVIAGFIYYNTAKAANKNKVDWGLIGFALTGFCAIVVDILYEKLIWNSDPEWIYFEFNKSLIPILHYFIISIIGLMIGLLFLAHLRKSVLSPK